MVDEPCSGQPEPEALLALHRYFIAASHMRSHFNEVIGQPRFSIVESNLYMSYWYAGLYVVIEGWQDLGLTDPSVDALLDSPNVSLLRRFRNSVFHYQRKYYSEKSLGLIRDGEEVAIWVSDLSEHLGRSILEQVQAANKSI